MKEEVTPIGTLETIRRFPFKGMAGETLPKTFLSFCGVMGDRIYALYNPQKKRSFPWVTSRDYPELLLYQTRFTHPAPTDAPFWDTENQSLQVQTPSGEWHEATSPKLIQHLRSQYGASLEIRFTERGMHDSRPVSIIGLETYQKIQEEAGLDIDERRFRANFSVRWDVKRPFFEDELIGKQIQIGDRMRLFIIKRDMRCQVITYDPENVTQQPEVLKTVGRINRGSTGVYATVVRNGVVRENDPIFEVQTE